LFGAGKENQKRAIDLWTYDLRTPSIKFPDGHKGHFVREVGFLIVDPEDEVLIPMLDRCTAVVADVVLDGKQVRAVSHLTSWVNNELSTNAPAVFLQQLSEVGEVSNAKVIAFNRGGSDGRAAGFAEVSAEATGLDIQPIELLDTEVGGSRRGYAPDVYIKGNELRTYVAQRCSDIDEARRQLEERVYSLS